MKLAETARTFVPYRLSGLRRRAWRIRGVLLLGEFEIDRTAYLAGGVRLGAHCRIRRNVTIVGPGVDVGSWAYVNDGAYIASQVRIGNRVAIGQFCRFITGTHELGASDHRAGSTEVRPITVGDGVWFGAGVTVLPGVSIGRGAVIAAGSVVTRDVDENCLVAGVPATVKRHLEAAGHADAGAF